MAKVFPSCFLLLLICLTGCQTLGGSAEKDDLSPLRLYMRANKTVVKTGEPVLVEVFLTNVNSEMVPVNELNIKSLTFYATRPTLNTPVKVDPVFSKLEPMISMREIEVDELVRREFVFTKLSNQPGEVTLVASYESDPSNAFNELYFASAREIILQVSQDEAFKRDLNGVLLEEEAVRIAREYFSQPQEAEATSRLLENEVGFLDWMVVFNNSDKDQAVGCLINPYLGTVRIKIDPTLYQEKKQKPVPQVYNQAHK
jgi:hypothetical protein